MATSNLPDDTFSCTFFDETTSPSQLHEMTLSDTMDGGAVGVLKMASPIRGRTMKEYEELLGSLRKENFNLKLRIYFLEERMGKLNGIKDKEEAIKHNIELKVETEELRKELSEKQELLVQAAKALDLLEEQHQEEIRRHAEEKAALDNRIQDLEKEIRDYELSVQQLMHLPKSLTQSQISQDSQDSQYSSAAFEAEHLAAQVQELTEQQDHLEAQLREQSESSKRLEKKLLQSDCRLDALKDVLHRLENLLEVPQSELINRVRHLKKCEQKLESTEQIAKDLRTRLTKQTESCKETEASLNENLTVMRKEIDNYKEEVKTLNVRLLQEAAIVRSCPKCQENEASTKSRLEDAKKCVDALRIKLREKEAEAIDLTEALAARDAKLVQFEKDHPLALRSIHGLVKRVKEMEKEREKLRSDLSRKEEHVARFENQKKEAKQEQWRQSMDQGYEQDILCQLQNFQATLREKEVQLVVCEQRLEIRDNQVRELQEEVESLKKDAVECLKHAEKQGGAEGDMRDNLLLQLEEKKREVDVLNRELQKRTINLQELVNKELWDKNKQIEKLELRLSNQASLFEQQEKSLRSAKKQLTSRGVIFKENSQVEGQDGGQTVDAASKAVSDDLKYLAQQVELLKERLRNTPERDNESRVMQDLRTENEHLMQQVEESKYWRREACRAISALRARLEELASFLAELLLQSDSLTGLPADRQHALRAVINQSLELSHTIATLSGAPNSSSINADLSLDALVHATQASSQSLCDLSHQNHCSVEISQGPLSALRSVLPLELHGFCGRKSPQKNRVEVSLRYTDSADETQVGQELSRIGTPPTNVNPRSPSLKSSDGSDGNARRQRCYVPEAMRRHSDGGAGTLIADVKAQDLPSPVHSTKSMPARPRCTARSSSRPVFKSAECVATTAVNICIPDACGSHSESESWSEPDRSVSQARIGLQDESLRNISVSSCSSTVRPVATKNKSTSSSNGTDQGGRRHDRRSRTESGSSDVRRLKRHVQILEGLNEALESQLHKFNQRSSSTCCSKPTSPSKALGESRKAIDALQEQVSLLETRLKERDNELLERQCALLEIRTASETKALEAEQRLQQAALSLRKLEDKLQELSVQVLEVELRREQAEQGEQRAAEECNKLRVESRQELLTLRARLEEALKSQSDLQEQLKEWKFRAEAALKDSVEWETKTRHLEQDMKENESRLNQELKQKTDVCDQLKRTVESQADEWRCKLQELEKRWKERVKLLEEQLKSKQVEFDREKVKWNSEINELVERRARELEAGRKADVDKRLQEAEQGLKSRLDSLERRAADATAEAEQRTQELEERYKAQECALKARLSEGEKRARAEECELLRQLDEASVAMSTAQLEQARLANEKLQLEQQTRRLQSEMARERRSAEERLKLMQEQLTNKLHSFMQRNAELYNRVKELERELMKSPGKRRPSSAQSSLPASPEGKVLTEITNLCRQRSVDMSDYVSEVDTDDAYHTERNYDWLPGRIPPSRGGGISEPALSSVGTRGSTASPDLGIESDQGRLSSQEPPHTLKKSTTAPCVFSMVPKVLDLRKKQQLDYCDLEQENLELKQRLQQTRQTLEQAYAQLAASNQRKRQVEKAICKQLHKTHHLLKSARSNLENPSSVCKTHDDSLVLVEVQVSRADQLESSE